MSDTTVLVVEDDAALREALCDTLQMSGYAVVDAEQAESALRVLAEQPVHMLISDVHMPGMDGHNLLRSVKQAYPELPCVLITAYGTVERAVEAMRDGAVDYLVKPFEAEVLVNMVGRYAASGAAHTGEMVAVDAKTRSLEQLARRVAASDATVLIGGESGTGKEVLARHIHDHSARAERPFVAINCAAIPDNMLEATLFGYEKGAFTGAYKASPGKFELAQGGTLLLDEISEMDLGLQAKILRVLQEREVERLGGHNIIKLDVRVLATSNRNMPEEVAGGRFREDLFYRLNVFPLTLPALRERVEDIVPLAEHLLVRAAKTNGRATPRLSEEAAGRLRAHGWPGNVRELDNVVQRALILQDGELIQGEDLHFETAPPAAARPAAPLADAPIGAASAREESGAEDTAAEEAGGDKLSDDLKSREWSLIIEALKQEMGSRKATAARLGISQRTLRYKLSRMREAGVRIPGDFGAQHA